MGTVRLMASYRSTEQINKFFRLIMLSTKKIDQFTTTYSWLDFNQPFHGYFRNCLFLTSALHLYLLGQEEVGVGFSGTRS